LKVWILAVGRPGRLLGAAIEEYERRAARYWSLATLEVKEERATGGRPADQVREAESARLLERVPPGAELIALTRAGERWSSDELAAYLDRLAVQARPGAAFVIGGAYGLGPAVLRAARHRLSLSTFTLPHDMARLLLAEQLYRAGTIVRGEPYHKAAG